MAKAIKIPDRALIARWFTQVSSPMPCNCVPCARQDRSGNSFDVTSVLNRKKWRRHIGTGRHCERDLSLKISADKHIDVFFVNLDSIDVTDLIPPFWVGEKACPGAIRNGIQHGLGCCLLLL